jgi:hypothetical protein
MATFPSGLIRGREIPGSTRVRKGINGDIQLGKFSDFDQVYLGNVLNRVKIGVERQGVRCVSKSSDCPVKQCRTW